MRIYDLTRKSKRLLGSNTTYKDIDIIVDSASIIYLMDNKEIPIHKINKYLTTLKDKNIRCTFEINILD